LFHDVLVGLCLLIATCRCYLDSVRMGSSPCT
jgi:hypothetical protein